MSPAAIGIDFGTTNSVVALAGADGSVMTRSFATKQGAVDAYRSALMFWREGRPPRPASPMSAALMPSTWPWA